jgi:DNA-binding transcriptional regulator YiaG
MASLQNFSLNGTNFTGNDLRRLILSLGLKTTEFSKQCSVAPRTLIRYCDYQDSAIPEELINNINIFIQGLPERTVLPIPLNGRRNNTIISFMQADHEALSGFYSLDSVDWARFFNYRDVRRWFNGERFVDNPKTVRILGILTHLTQSFACQGLTLADEEPLNVRGILLSSQPHSLEQYYDEQKSPLPDWRQCLDNSILKRPPSITGFELARMRLSEGASQADYSKILTPCIQKNIGRDLEKLEGFDDNPINFSTVQDGYLMQDVLCQRFDTTLVLPIPIRGRQKNGQLHTFTQQEINNLVQFFDLTTNQLALLCGVTPEAARIWRSGQRTITQITPLRTLGVLELLMQAFENYRFSLYQDPDNLDQLRNLNLEAKEGLNGILGRVII